MSELVALSFDADASPSLAFESPPAAGGAPGAAHAALYGWGVGWYPSSDRGASVVKDPTSAGASSVSSALGDWHRFRSTIFLCHLRSHRRPRNQEDAQPFVRSYGGRQWIFAHDGDLAPRWAARHPLHDDPAFEPLGRTDSEHAFCWLLARLHERRARALADVPPDALQGWLRELNRGGQLNALLTDANLMICLARLLQVPARYRMGYIHTGADYANKIQSDASHAWVELYVPRVGWHGFDPTNGIQVGADHVRVTCGRNYRDATPTSGTIYRGGSEETLSIRVRVEAEDEDDDD